MNTMETENELRNALGTLKRHFHITWFFSIFVTALSLTPTWYMMQLYDRVMNSRSPTTLIMLTLVVLLLALLQEGLEWARVNVLHQAGLKLDAVLKERIFTAVFESNLRRLPEGNPAAIYDLKTVRDFLASPAMLALVDAPLSLSFLVLIFLINPIMGLMSVVGAMFSVGLSFLTEKTTRAPMMEANKYAGQARSFSENALRNAQVIETMGMLEAMHARWLKLQKRFLMLQSFGSERAGSSGALSRFVQMTQASLLLAVGCWLTLKGLFAGGGIMIFIASILGARALGPIVQALMQWQMIVGARDAYQRLDKMLKNIPARTVGMPLPRPSGHLAVENVSAGAPGNPSLILHGVNFQLPAGEILAVIGPSAAGKSTLARLLVGIWPALSGKVRLDGVDVFSWNKEELGPHIGYLPQDVELFDGTLAENIARFGDVDMGKVEAATRAVGIHDTLAALPQGYNTMIGEDGCILSGGQRQRVALARAIYGNPCFIVLDEPNSSLDQLGEAQLMETLMALKAAGSTIVIITHRNSVLAAVDRILVMRDGRVAGYGTRDQIFAALQPPAPAPETASAAAAA